MKTTTKELPVADCRLPIERRNGPFLFASIVNRKSRIVNRAAFTLIELLVVIAIMAILAAFTMGVITQIKKVEYVNTATAELNQIATALESYKAKYGVYPPGNALPPTSYGLPQTNTMFSPLYYELSGVTNNTRLGTFVTLDGATEIKVSDVQTAFGVGGFINCAKTGDEAAAAQDFLPSLKANRIGTCPSAGGVLISNLITSVRGPDTTYTPLGTSYPDMNPFRYVYPGVNNPSSYDLYVQLMYRGKMYLVCNWSKNAIINSPLP
jgi:prepilin-type N-terminal cleavage/methylation domain-containing protein